MHFYIIDATDYPDFRDNLDMEGLSCVVLVTAWGPVLIAGPGSLEEMKEIMKILLDLVDEDTSIEERSALHTDFLSNPLIAMVSNGAGQIILDFTPNYPTPAIFVFIALSAFPSAQNVFFGMPLANDFLFMPPADGWWLSWERE
ncbi:MAG: hypothetical protein P4M02_04740 [Clostridia bacterium]|nr:hypothetical protein [Clostridia bacterium]